MWVPGVEEFTDDGRTQVRYVRRDYFAAHAIGHGIEKLLQTGIIAQPEERDLGLQSSRAVEFGHGGVQGLGHGWV